MCEVGTRAGGDDSGTADSQCFPSKCPPTYTGLAALWLPERIFSPYRQSHGVLVSLRNIWLWLRKVLIADEVLCPRCGSCIGSLALTMGIWSNSSSAVFALLSPFSSFSPSSFEFKPYEELNGIQNFVTYPRQDVYMKGATHRGPDYALVSKVYHKAIKVSQDGDFKANILYEYFPLRKISTIPCGTTGFCHDPHS
ncbi:hypothetical protein Hypma_016570 [Hypsizygus marmoreus]|uniref:Uncharacterized protein n=1 Tax=Hypsizygus marmoreus TaxID=39966 RepID=A0A369IY16_HYPMA|nr:hypothetical protein Hypma_016570 [Hypsizygus marmoreus]